MIHFISRFYPFFHIHVCIVSKKVTILQRIFSFFAGYITVTNDTSVSIYDQQHLRSTCEEINIGYFHVSTLYLIPFTPFYRPKRA